MSAASHCGGCRYLGPGCYCLAISVRRRQRGGTGSWKPGTKPGCYLYPPESMPLVGGKPVSLLRAILADYSEPGDLVLDPCCGAGSTLQAAEDMGRRWIGVDSCEEHSLMASGRMGAGIDSGPLFSKEKK